MSVLGRRIWPLVVLIAWFTLQSHDYVRVFQSNQTLWAHAVTAAPYKPRVVVNYGLTLLQANQLQAGVAQLALAHQLAALPHIPESDRAITQATVEANIQAMRQASR